MATTPRIRINGPLVPFVGRVWSHLLAQGYRPRSSKNLLRLVSHLSRWLVDAGLRQISQNVHTNFWRLRQRAGLNHRRPHRPRIHDLRHSFAVKTIRCWYEAGLDVEPRLPFLSTYLGHVSPTSTYLYLTATPELMALAAKRLERAVGKLP